MGNLAGAVILSGIVIVFAILVILIGVVNLTGRIVNKEAFEKAPAPSKPAPAAASTPPAPLPPAAAPAPVVEAGITGETVAVIAAAVSAVMDEQAPGTAYAVTSIQRSRQGRPVWGFAGMQQNTRPF